MYLLDTSTCIFFLRGKLDLDKLIGEKGFENFYVSEITMFELRYGAENSSDPVKSNNAVDKFLTGLNVIPILSCITRYAKEKARLRKSGKLIHDEFDLLIGATALEHDLTLVTDNVKDFARLNGIKLENWVNRK